MRWARVRYDDSGRVRGIEHLSADGEDVATTTFGYDSDDRLVLMRRSDVDGDSVSREVDYDDGKLTKIIHRVGTYNPLTEEVDLTSWTETWPYDGADRPERILIEGLGEPTITELSWDAGAGLLDGTKTTTGGIASGAGTHAPAHWLHATQVVGVVAHGIVRECGACGAPAPGWAILARKSPRRTSDAPCIFTPGG